MRDAGRELQLHVFDADHAFANPSNPRYDTEVTARAFALVIDFFRAHP